MRIQRWLVVALVVGVVAVGLIVATVMLNNTPTSVRLANSTGIDKTTSVSVVAVSSVGATSSTGSSQPIAAIQPTATPVPTIKAGVTVGGAAVGNLDREAARTALQHELATFEQHPLTLSFQQLSWSPTLADLGISTDVESSLDKAFAASANASVPLMLNQLDENKLKTYLTQKIAPAVNQDMVEPQLVLGQQTGQLQITNSGKIGYKLDSDQSVAALKARLLPQQGLTELNSSPKMDLVVQSIAPDVTPDEVNNLKSQVYTVLSRPLTIHYADKTWKLDATTLTTLLELSPKPAAKSASGQPTLYSTAHFGLNLNRDKLTAFITQIAQGINQKVQEGKLGWDTDHPIALSPSKSGLAVDVPTSVDSIVQKLAKTNANDESSVNLTVQTLKPTLDTSNLAALGLKDLVGEGVSHYGGSIEARGHNIETGAKYLTGTFIKPHSTFSFLDSVGDITAARGYWKGYSIVADQTVPDVGGGMCQVSTTTFRAAFFAGLPIVERHPHAYRVHWYEEMGEPVGFDAAVYEPGLDMKFANPYDTWLYLQAYTQGGYLHVRLFGTKVAGQTIELKASGPSNFKPALPDKIQYDPTLPTGTRQQLDYAQQGLDANIARIVKVNGMVVRTDNYFSRFEPWGNIFLVGGTPPKKTS